MTKKENEKDQLFAGDDKKQKIATPSPQELSTFGKAAPGTEAIRAEDTIFPRWRLLQKTSAEVEDGKSQAGMIKHSLTGEEFKELKLIFLMLGLTRVMFNQEDRKGAPLCRSTDLKAGSDCACGCDSNCEVCEYAKWVKGTPPTCSLVYNYPTLQVEQIGKSALPTLLTAMKSSAPAAQKINTFVKWQTPAKPFWAFVVKVSAYAKKFSKGTAYMWDFTMDGDTNEEQMKWAEGIYALSVAGKEVAPTEYDND